MSDYTPTTEEVRATASRGIGGDWFDRWHAEEIRKAREEAWDECYSAGYEHVQAENPYKIEEGAEA